MDIARIWKKWVDWIFVPEGKALSRLIISPAFLLFSAAAVFPICLANASSLFLLFWLSSLFLSLFIFSHFATEAKSYTSNLAAWGDVKEKEAKLWQNRFETIRERSREDRSVLEQEIDQARLELQDKQKHITSLKALVALSHRESNDAIKKAQELAEAVNKNQFEPLEIEGKNIDQEELTRIIDELNFYRTEHYQVTLLLQEAKEKLRLQEEAIAQRQKRNQTLLSTSSPKAISLQDLARGL